MSQPLSHHQVQLHAPARPVRPRLRLNHRYERNPGGHLALPDRTGASFGALRARSVASTPTQAVLHHEAFLPARASRPAHGTAARPAGDGHALPAGQDPFHGGPPPRGTRAVPGCARRARRAGSRARAGAYTWATAGPEPSAEAWPPEYLPPAARVQYCTGSRMIGQVMQWPPPRPRPSSAPTMVMTSTPALRSWVLVWVLRS